LLYLRGKKKKNKKKTNRPPLKYILTLSLAKHHIRYKTTHNQDSEGYSAYLSDVTGEYRLCGLMTQGKAIMLGKNLFYSATLSVTNHTSPYLNPVFIK
jgi:hypothetical protein